MANFGHAMRGEWLLDPDVTYLNHGTVGVTPRRVLDHQREIIDEIERQPAKFMLRELADPDGTFTATVSACALPPRQWPTSSVLRRRTSCSSTTSRPEPTLCCGRSRSRPGDEIAVTNLGYGGVTNAARYVARTIGGTLRTIELPQPGVDPGDFVDAIANGLGDRTRLLVVDHMTAATAMVLPLAEIAALCHERGVLVLGDGAHVPGNIPVDIDSLGVDWYVANLHKWAWAPRSAGLLWSAKQHQDYLHPPVISWGLDNGIAAEFDLPGTRDPSAFLAAPFAIDLLAEFGGADGVAAIYRHNHDLAWWAGQYLADRWGTRFTTPEQMIGSMVNVRLPATFGTTNDDAERLRADLEAAGIEVPIYAAAGELTMRVSAQIYCNRADIEQLGDAVAKLATN